jgi:hypothetical protein
MADSVPKSSLYAAAAILYCYSCCRCTTSLAELTDVQPLVADSNRAEQSFRVSGLFRAAIQPGPLARFTT